MTTNKTDYLLNFRFSQDSTSQMNFLARWCEEEGRDIEKLMVILNTIRNPRNAPFVPENYLENTLVRYLDVKYNVCILLDQYGQTLKIF